MMEPALQEFESILQAMRKIKDLLPELSRTNEIYLMVDDYGERFYVASGYGSSSKLEDVVDNDFDYDDTAEKHARAYKIFEYITVDEVNSYPYLHKKSKPSKLSGVKAFRKQLLIETEYSVSFNIMG